MSGQNVSETIKKVDELLKEYESRLGIKELEHKNADLIEKYIQASPDEIRKMSPDDCIEAAIILSQYSWFMQRAYNQELTNVNWAEAKLKKLLATEGSKYRAPSADERRYLCIVDNEYAGKLEQLRGGSQARADRINFLSNRADAVAKMYVEAQYTKRSKNYAN